MFVEKVFYRFSLVPTCPIDIKPDGIALQPSIEMAQHLEESFPITFARLNHTVATQQRGHPPRNVQPQPVLTGGDNAQTLPPFSPTSTQPRMQAKTRLVLEHHRLSSSQRFKFFLKPCETCGPLQLSPVDKYNRPASADSLGDASTSEPALPLGLSPSGALSGSPKSAHPTVLDLTRSPAATSLGGPQWSFASSPLSQWACRASVSVVMPANPLGSPHGSNDSNSSALDPRLPLSILDAAPLKPKARRQSLSLPRPQGFPPPMLKGVLSSPQNESNSEKGSSWNQYSMIVAICNFIYDVCNSFRLDNKM